jgi:uncharacterized protein (DUF2236 family)
MARTINREIVVLLGWGRAILLQFAHPLVAQGVADHSLFGPDPREYVSRAWRTVGAMLTLTFGSEDEARVVAARINAIHDRVVGRLQNAAGRYPAGTPYAASDPELLRWVHATLLDSLPLAYERFVAPLTTSQKDQYCREAAAAAPLLRLPQELAPSSCAELGAYMHDMFATHSIEVTPPAREMARSLLSPHLGPVMPLFRVARLATIGMLPQSVRRGYGFEWTARDERRLTRISGMIRRARAFAPPVVREWPAARRRPRPAHD